MAGALVVLVIGLTLVTTPVFSQDDGKSGGGGAGTEQAEKRSSLFDDDPTPAHPGEKNNEKPLDELGDVPVTHSPSDAGGKPADAAKAAIAGAVPAQPQLSAAVDPQAAPVKQEIQAALERNDEPAAHQLMSRALQRFPNDPELKDARSSLWSHLPSGKAQEIIDMARGESAKLFGQQWIPGRTSDEDVALSIEQGPARGTRMFGGPVTSVLKQGYSLLDRGDPARAEQVLSKAIGRNRDSAALYYARVMARGLNGDYKGADGDSLKAVTLSHERAVALSQRAGLMMEMGRRDEAFAWANRALQAEPNDANALAVRGRYLWKDQGRTELALEDLRRAAKIDPGQYETLYQEGQRRFYGQRAVTSFGRGDYRQAFVSSGLALQADPSSAQAHLVRGMVYWKMGKVEETIKDTTLALKADPKSTWALFQRGLAMEALGRRDFAIADFKRAAALNPKKFNPILDRLLQAQHEGRREPIWPREGGSVAFSN
jgi:tetratricopeptide (TPR) repeat protein